MPSYHKVGQLIRRGLMGLMAVALILLALSFSAFRLLLPELPQLQKDIEAIASQAVGKPLDIGSMQAEWAGWGPRLRFYDVSIRSPIDGDELVALGELTLGTHMLQLLSDQPLRPASVHAEGLRLVVEQTEKGGLRLRGFDSSRGNQSDFLGPLLDFLAARGTISLGRTEVLWVPQPGANIEAESAWFDLAFFSGGGKYHIELSGQPPASIGNNLELIMDAEGSMADMLNMRGEVFIQAQGFQLHSPWVQPLLATLPLEVSAGLLKSGDFNLRWDRQETTQVTSRVSLQELQISLPNESEAQRDKHLLQGFDGDLSWSSHGSASSEKDTLKNLAALARRWTLKSDKAQLMVSGEPVLMQGFELHADGAEGLPTSFRGSMQSLRWGKVFAQLEGFPLSENLSSALKTLAPEGQLAVNEFTLSQSQKQGWQLQAAGAFENLGWRSGKLVKQVGSDQHKGWPGIKNLTGKFQLDSNSAKLQIDSQQLALEWPWLYSGERLVDQLVAEVDLGWQHDQQGGFKSFRVTSERIRLQKAQAQAEVGLALELNLAAQKPEGVIRLQGQVQNSDMALVKQFLPAFTPAAAKGWLERALVAGNLDGSISIDGPLGGFPYADNQGQFKADVTVNNAALEFAEQWPMVERASAQLAFRNLSLHANVQEAQTSGVSTQALRVSIANLAKPEVVVLAQAEAPLAELLSYVRQSPLQDPVAPLIKGLSAEGRAALSLNLNIPVFDFDSLSVNGELTLADGRLQSSEFLLLKEVNGRLNFSQERVVASDMLVNFHGFNSLAQLDLSLTGGDMLVTSSAKFEPSSNLEQRAFAADFLPSWFLNMLVGSTELAIDLSGYDGAAPAEKIRLTSNLDGLALKGPNGLSKAAEQRAPFEMTIDRSLASGIRVTGHAQHLGGVDLWLANDDGGELRRAEFAAGNARASLPAEDAIGVVLDVPQADLDDFLQWFEAQLASDALATKTAESKNLLLPDGLDYLRLRSDEFRALGITWHALQAHISRSGNATLLNLVSADGKGSVRVPDRAVSSEQIADLGEAARALQQRRLAEQIEVDFDYLYLPDLVRAPELEVLGPPKPQNSDVFDPRQLPVVKARIKDARYMGVRLGQLNVETQPGVSGLVMRSLRSRGGWLDIDAGGRWDVYQQQHHSELSLKLASNDWDSVMEGIGLPEVLGAKEANVSVNLQWPDAMTKFDAEQASGGFSVDFKQGQIHQVDPGIGRILGLFSFYTLPRRLLLDFSDIATAGLTFDRIRGDFTVNNGNAWTDNLVINARGADASIVGRAGMVEQDYDQRITVKPQLGGGTAVVGALVSGVGVGALLLLVNELFGQPIDDLGVLRLHLGGSWDEPLINGKALPEEKPSQRPSVDQIQFGRPVSAAADAA